MCVKLFKMECPSHNELEAKVSETQGEAAVISWQKTSKGHKKVCIETTRWIPTNSLRYSGS